jgi:putative transposase
MIGGTRRRSARAAKTWRRLQGQNQLPKVITGVTFRDGVEVIPTSDQRAA